MPNSGVTQSIESLVGPCSEVISIAGFLSSDSHDKLQHAIVESENAWDGLSDQEKQVIEGECSLSDLRECLEKTWDNPTLSTYLLKEHESSMNALYAANPKNKRQTKKPYLPDPEILPGEVIALQKELDGARLNCWKSDSASSLFVRTPRNADYNTLNAVRPSNTQTQVLNGERSAVLTISVYSKVPWGPSYVNRICQQAYLSWQTLRDIYDALPCIFKAGTPSTESHLGVQPGCAICIEGVLYSDSPPFADNVISHLRAKGSGKGSPVPTKHNVPMLEVKLSSLSARLHKPYTLLHSGNCEHFIVFEQIRLRHPSDPVSGYPQILQVTPPISTLCRACHKVPAVLSVVGDIRLGESPCILCGPCWDAMGLPVDTEAITTIPLPVLPTVTPQI